MVEENFVFGTRAPSGKTYRKIRADEPLWIMFDGGNTEVKAMIHGNFGEEIFFPHAVRKLEKSEYDPLAAPYKNRHNSWDGTAIFWYEGHGYVVGQQATQVGKGETLTGAAKYIRGHYGAMFIAAMIQLYPDGHDNVNVVALHPPSLEPDNLKALWKSLKGKHVVILPNGSTIVYNVAKIIDLEEPVAALQTFVLTTDGKEYDHPQIKFTPGTEVLSLDVGGGLSVFVPCLINGAGQIEINFDAPPIPTGIRDIENALAKELKSTFPELTPLKKIPRNMITEALHGSITISGKSAQSCQKQLDNAMQTLAFPIRTSYVNDYNSGVNFRAIIISGGGGAGAFDYLKANVLNHGFVFPAEKSPNRMRFGAIRGASKGLIPFLSTKGYATQLQVVE